MRVNHYEFEDYGTNEDDGRYVAYEDYAALEARCLELAAENAGLKAALRPSDIPSEWTDAFGDTAVIEHEAAGDNQGHSVSWSWVGNQEEVIKSVLLAVDKGIETPATDAFLAEVRAEHLQSYAGSIAARMKDKSISMRQKERLNFAWAEAKAYIAELHNAQLRKGVQS